MKHSITMLAAAAVLALALPAGAVTIHGTASPSATVVGSDALVTLTLDVSEDFSPLSMTFNLDWPGTGLALNLDNSSALGQSWQDFAAALDPDFTLIDQSAGHLGLSSFGTLPTLTAGSHTVQMSFTGLAAGTHAVNYELDLGDPNGGPDFVVAGSTSINVTAVPEPHPALMLAAGLAAIGLIARRRRS